MGLFSDKKSDVRAQFWNFIHPWQNEFLPTPLPFSLLVLIMGGEKIVNKKNDKEGYSQGRGGGQLLHWTICASHRAKP